MQKNHIYILLFLGGVDQSCVFHPANERFFKKNMLNMRKQSELEEMKKKHENFQSN